MVLVCAARPAQRVLRPVRQHRRQARPAGPRPQRRHRARRHSSWRRSAARRTSSSSATWTRRGPRGGGAEEARASGIPGVLGDRRADAAGRGAAPGRDAEPPRARGGRHRRRRAAGRPRRRRRQPGPDDGAGRRGEGSRGRPGRVPGAGAHRPRPAGRAVASSTRPSRGCGPRRRGPASCVVFGMPSLDPIGRRDSGVVLGPDGALLTRYDALVVDERGPFEPGPSAAAMWFEVRGVPAVVTVGGDVLWNEIAELAAIGGAQIHCHLANDAGGPARRADRLRRDQLWVNLASYRTITVTANAARPPSGRGAGAAPSGAISGDSPGAAARGRLGGARGAGGRRRGADRRDARRAAIEPASRADHGHGRPPHGRLAARGRPGLPEQAAAEPARARPEAERARPRGERAWLRGGARWLPPVQRTHSPRGSMKSLGPASTAPGRAEARPAD